MLFGFCLVFCWYCCCCVVFTLVGLLFSFEFWYGQLSEEADGRPGSSAVFTKENLLKKRKKYFDFDGSTISTRWRLVSQYEGLGTAAHLGL